MDPPVLPGAAGGGLPYRPAGRSDRPAPAERLTGSPTPRTPPTGSCIGGPTVTSWDAIGGPRSIPGCGRCWRSCGESGPGSAKPGSSRPPRPRGSISGWIPPAAGCSTQRRRRGSTPPRWLRLSRLTPGLGDPPEGPTGPGRRRGRRMGGYEHPPEPLPAGRPGDDGASGPGRRLRPGGRSRLNPRGQPVAAPATVYSPSSSSCMAYWKPIRVLSSPGSFGMILISS